MRPISEIRRDRLRRLIDEVAEGNQARFAAMIDKSRAYVGFWLTDPAKPHAKAMGHEEARRIEARFSKPAGWLDTDPASQFSGLDSAMLGVALTSMDKVIRDRGLRMEGHLGRYAPVLAFAYEAARSEFPSGPPMPDTRSGKSALRAFDKKVDAWLGGGLQSGSIGPFEPAAAGSTASTGRGAAEGKAAALGRRRAGGATAKAKRAGA